MKVFKTQAKTKDEIRLDQERDIKEQAAGRKTEGSPAVVSVGLRPAYLTAGSATQAADTKDGPWQAAKTKKDRR